MLEHARVIWLISIFLLRNQRNWTHQLCWTCRGHLTNQNIPREKSEAMDSHPILGHTKIIRLVKGTPYGKSEAVNSLSMLQHTKVIWLISISSWEDKGSGPTSYIKTYRGHLIDQNIPPEKPEALDSRPILEHPKINWLIRTSILRNQRHWTHQLYWNIQKPFDSSGYPSWEIRALDSPTILEHAKAIWPIRSSLLRNQRHWTHCLC